MQKLRNILVMKFGGTSVGSPAAMEQVLGNIRSTRQNWRQLVIVTSALSGITDLLLKSARQAADKDIKSAEEAAGEIVCRHEELINYLIPNSNHRLIVKREIAQLTGEFLALCQEIYRQGEVSPRSLDAIAGLGERLAIRVLAGALKAIGINAAGIEATQLIVTDDNFLNAEPDLKATTLKTRRALDPLLARGVIPVVTGFIAATPDGIPTTLGRGGSDYSAAVLAAALNARETWIWTDVDGVMTADPRLVPEARTILQLSYDEVVEMASLGAKVLHPKTIQPIIKTGGMLRVRNTFNPAHPGTLLVRGSSSAEEEKGNVKAVTVIRGLRWDERSGEKDQKRDFYHLLFNAATTGDRPRAYQTKRVASEDADMVTVICPGLRSSPGVAGQVFSALEQARIKVLASSYGTSDISMNLFIGTADTQNAMRVLHGLIQ